MYYKHTVVRLSSAPATDGRPSRSSPVHFYARPDATVNSSRHTPCAAADCGLLQDAWNQRTAHGACLLLDIPCLARLLCLATL